MHFSSTFTSVCHNHQHQPPSHFVSLLLISSASCHLFLLLLSPHSVILFFHCSCRPAGFFPVLLSIHQSIHPFLPCCLHRPAGLWMVLLGAGVADACLPGLWGATGVCNDHGKTYALYAITVLKRNQDGSEECWKTYRRYSDFHDFHMRITEQVCVNYRCCIDCIWTCVCACVFVCVTSVIQITNVKKKNHALYEMKEKKKQVLNR